MTHRFCHQSLKDGSENGRTLCWVPLRDLPDMAKVNMCNYDGVDCPDCLCQDRVADDHNDIIVVLSYLRRIRSRCFSNQSSASFPASTIGAPHAPGVGFFASG